LFLQTQSVSQVHCFSFQKVAYVQNLMRKRDQPLAIQVLRAPYFIGKTSFRKINCYRSIHSVYITDASVISLSGN